jgi:hypothetical protein
MRSNQSIYAALALHLPAAGIKVPGLDDKVAFVPRGEFR